MLVLSIVCTVVRNLSKTCILKCPWINWCTLIGPLASVKNGLFAMDDHVSVIGHKCWRKQNLFFLCVILSVCSLFFHCTGEKKKRKVSKTEDHLLS